LILALPLLGLWGLLIHHLQVEWSVNTQYTYGWAVPCLAAYLLWRKWPEIRCQRTAVHRPGLALVLCGLLALAYAPTRLVEQANPDWRLMSWALALEVAGLTLLLVHAALGRRVLAAAAFPILFCLVAVPWPIPLVEQPLIQSLTRLDTAVCAEFFGWLGIPVIPHGNVIELSCGMVGIDEACSGIRSFQATLMIALFLGEYYRLQWPRRAGLVLAGFSLSIVFNLARMILLVWVAAHHGVPAIAAWHDPAGVTILLGCFLGLWLLGSWLGKKRRAEPLKAAARKNKIQNPPPADAPPQSGSGAALHPQPVSTPVLRFALGLTMWLVLVEFSVQGWYAWHAARVPAAPQWTVAWPTNAPGFKAQPVADVARQILRFDEGGGAAWEAAGCQWSAVFLRWNPGRAAIHLAQNHTPDVCLTAAGHTLKSISPQTLLEVNGFHLPFSINQVMDSPQPLYVFYCLWDDRATHQGFDTRSLTHANRLAPVWSGRRNPGQRSLEILLLGPESAAAAQAAVQAQLEKIVTETNKAE